MDPIEDINVDTLADTDWGLPNRRDAVVHHNQVVLNERVPGVRPAYRLSHRVRPTDVTTLETTFGISVVNPITASPHKFPNLECESLVAEDAMFAILRAHHGSKLVVDPAAHPLHHLERERQDLWSCCPPGDSTAALYQAEASCVSNACKHSWALCDCVLADLVVYDYSIQLFTVDEIAAHMVKTSRRVAYATVRHMTDISGEFYKGELRYFRASPQHIMTTLNGLKPVLENAIDWLLDRPGKHLTCTGHVIVPTLVSTVGHSSVYMLTLSDVLDYPPDYQLADWTPATLDLPDDYQVLSMPNTLYGTSSGYSLSWAQLRIEKVAYFGKVAVMYGYDRKPVVFSRAIASLGSRIFRGKPRDRSLYTSVVRFVNQQYNQVPNLPEHLKDTAHMATTILIMADSVEMETALLRRLVEDCEVLWATHARAVNFEQYRRYDLIDIGVYSTVACSTVYSTYAWATYAAASAKLSVTALATPHLMSMVAATVVAAPSIPIAAIAFSAVGWGLIGCNYIRKIASGTYSGTQHKQSPLEAWMTHTPGTKPPEVPTGVHPPPCQPVFGPTELVKKATADMVEENTIVRRAPPAIERPERNKLRCVGIGFTSIVPHYFASTADNEYRALVLRLALPTPEPLEGLWSQLADAYNQHPFQIEYHKRLADGVLVNRIFASKYAAKFPHNRRKELMDAFDEWLATGIMTREDLKVSAFVKVEKLDKSETTTLIVFEVLSRPEDNALSTPRIIISMRPKLSIVFGTIVSQLAAARLEVQRDWPVEFGSICPICPHGVSGEEIGEWTEAAIDKLGGEGSVMFFCADATLHDAHTREDAQEAQHSVYSDNIKVFPPQARTVLSYPILSGKSSKGVTFRLRYRRGSGLSDTDGGNTVITEMKGIYCTTPQDELTFGDYRNVSTTHLGTDVCLAACGDDLFGVMTKKHYALLCKAGDPTSRWKQASRELGYVDTPRFSSTIEDVDFCSRWFYPTPDGLLPGGKIGRTLVRAGWSIEDKDEVTIRSMTLGQLNDNYHVPFLREYFTRVEELTSGWKLGGKISEYSIHMGKRHQYDESTLAFVERKYGLTSQDLREFVAMLAKCDRLPILISWPHLERCARVDDA